MTAIVPANKKLRPYIHKPRATPLTTYGPTDICQAYSFPTGLTDGGVIAVIELGGGRVPANLNEFCAKYAVPAPDVVDVNCDSSNSPGTEADGEVELDLQYASGSYSFCTGKPAQIRVYWATDFAPALNRILADKKAGVPIVAISNSWGAPEDQLGAATCLQVSELIAQAAALGMIFFAAAGDNDSGDGEAGAHVDFPASNPYTVGCGGTSKPADGLETVWNDGPGEGTGGGYSSVFPTQAWQTGAPPPPVQAPALGRMVPDLAMNADPRTGYEVYIGSQGGWQVVGGTSAVAPIAAGLFAAIKPPLGLATAALTAAWGNKDCFSDITSGGNGAYQAAVGPDPCTGLGTPIGARLAQLFSASAPAPDPPAPEPPAPEPPAPEPPAPAHHHKHHKRGRRK